MGVGNLDYTTYWPDGTLSTTDDPNNNFFTVTAGEIDADTSTEIVDNIPSISITPGYRSLYVKARLKNIPNLPAAPIVSDSVSNHALPVMIYPKDMVAATKTAQTRNPVCLPGTEWPKVLSDLATDGTVSAFLGMNIDQTNGNIVSCGWST
jgi:hypothetical protein